jgi:16S rRNA G966 N2-methylase RsmD
LLAARKLQLAEVPVIVLDHLTEAQKRAYILADNQLALNAGWDDTLLAAELAALQNEDFNLDLIGFEDQELARLLAAQDAAEGLTDEDAVPELPETPISALGDLWILGDHRLLVGDATDTGAVAKLMDGAPADLVFTDPPYNVDYEGYTEQRLKIRRKGPLVRRQNPINALAREEARGEPHSPDRETSRTHRARPTQQQQGRRRCGRPLGRVWQHTDRL